MLIQFETWHLAKGNSINSLGVYMRSLRAIYNKGVKAGVVPKELPYPFAEYKIKTKPTAKRAISYESVKKIMDLELSESHPCFHERNIFVASFLAYGMNYADLAMLKLSHVADGRLTYHRQKTGKIYDIKITPQLDEILSYYMKGKTTDDFIFPIVKRDSSELQYRDVMWARRRYNVKLKEIGKLAGLDTPLTSYVARHTFASLANHQGIPVSAISHMLGHSDLKTTQVYLESLSSKALDEYNLVITGQNQ